MLEKEPPINSLTMIPYFPLYLEAARNALHSDAAPSRVRHASLHIDRVRERVAQGHCSEEHLYAN